MANFQVLFKFNDVAIFYSLIFLFYFLIFLDGYPDSELTEMKLSTRS